MLSWKKRRGALGLDASANSQLSKLRCGDFVGLAAVPILRVEARDHRLSFMLWHDVHGQPPLPTLWRGCGDQYGFESSGIEVSQVPSGYVADHDWWRGDARV